MTEGQILLGSNLGQLQSKFRINFVMKCTESYLNDMFVYDATDYNHNPFTEHKSRY